MIDKKNIKATNKEVWTKLSKEWAVLVPPERPSGGEINIYRDKIKKIACRKKGKIKAMLMGATPEIRDLLAEFNAEVTIVDVNPNMIKAMSNLLEFSNGQEKVVVSNWLDIPLKSDQFDLALCDHGPHHVHFREWPKLLKEVSRLLKKNGHFLLNMVTVRKKEALSVKELINHVKYHALSHEDVFYYQYRCYFKLQDQDKLKYLKNLVDYQNELKNYLEKKIITPDQYDMLTSPWPFKVTLAPKEALDEILGEYFIIKSVNANNDHPVFSLHKIYLLQQK